MTAGRPLHILFNDAVAALRSGPATRAKSLCEELLERAPGTVEVEQLLAIAEMQLGEFGTARRLLANLHARNPADLGVAANLGQCLLALGEDEDAVRLLRALVERGGGRSASLALAEACIRTWRLAEAHAVLRSLLDTEQVDPAATRQLSRVLAMAGDDKAASGVLDDGLRQVPADADLLSARIRLAAECGEDPQPFLQRVPQGAMTPEGLAMLRVDVSLAAGDLAEARATLEEGLARNPLWLDGHRQLAQLLAQVEQPEAIGRHFADLLTKHPSAEPLHRLRVQMLQATERWEESLAAIVSARERCSDPLLHEELDQLEAVAFDEAGHRDRAAAAFARTGSPNTNFRLAHVRHLLRRGDWDGAARKAEAVAGETNHGAAWAYLASAWRLTGDTRAQWLAGDDAFVRTFDLDQAFSMLDELADRLRGLHKGHAHPIGQSLRSGTQTHGNLFTLRDPLIRRLRDMFAAAVSDYAAGLPPFDPKHPLLSKPREQRTFTGSWSVRLTDGGHHVSHIHPEGWISSAFYVTLPSGEATAGEQAGWLHLGKPPEELGLDLPPLRVVEPKRGRLAIFPSYLWHGTNKFGAGERMSVAFDMVPLIDDRL